ncbi:MAG: tRNA (adenine-N1)-methyltransferase [Nitrospirae bacterium]|nr:tRNA (adenine-N1)-methyltransferase [Nitrospirota bacterium]MBI3352905.1 tRNA (adenine-N1)-methyltransferase [Nitrospirota bacterium]
MIAKELKEGEWIHLIDYKERVYTLVLKKGARFQYSGQFLAHDEVIGKPEGIKVVFSSGKEMTVLRPTYSEYVLKMPRGAQIIYPKDTGQILMLADIYPGATVLEAGIGSGALSMAILRCIGPAGTLISYETREDFAKRALLNIEQYMGPPTNLILKHQDIYKEITEQDLDRIVLDVPEPWQVVPHARISLRTGGVFLSYLPTIVQVIQLVETLRREKGFSQINVSESLVREWKVDGQSVRPDHRMVAHTAFLTTARRINY